jgi:hypothetical protein
MAIEKIEINGFRGISKNLQLEFTSNGKPCSIILTGDNGSGKSSIVDAIELALQARICGNKSINSNNAQCVVSYTKPETTRVRALLSDMSVVERTISQDEDMKYTITDGSPHPKFRVSPMVLHRSDILEFIDAPEVRRQAIFLSYLRGANHNITNIADASVPIDHNNINKFNESLPQSPENPTDEINNLASQEYELKQSRRKVRDILAAQMKVATEEIPLERSEFEEYIRNKLRLGISKKDGRNGNLMRGGIHIEVKPNVEKYVNEIRLLTDQIYQIRKKIGQIKKIIKGEQPRFSRISTVLNSLGTRITESYKKISPSRSFIDKIDVNVGADSPASLTFEIYLKNGTKCSPKRIFSEANLDLLALLVFLGVLKESAELGQDKIIILDDVLQSVDSSIRVMVTDHILQEFDDWQIFFTVHDRLWRNQLCDAFRRNKHPFVEKEIIRWKFEDGPVVIAGQSDIGQSLKSALDRGEISDICIQSGRLLEVICNVLSWTLSISIVRKKDDLYTLGDLWPGIVKVLRKTNIKDSCTAVDTWIGLRNMVGAHYNEWAHSLSLDEATYFGQAVLNLLESVRCAECYRWIEQVSQRDVIWECRCRKRVVHQM